MPETVTNEIKYTTPQERQRRIATAEANGKTMLHDNLGVGADGKPESTLIFGYPHEITPDPNPREPTAEESARAQAIDKLAVAAGWTDTEKNAFRISWISR